MDSEWQSIRPIKTVTLIDGSTVKPSKLLMRKKVDGEWIYRLPTDDEELEFMSGEVW